MAETRDLSYFIHHLDGGIARMELAVEGMKCGGCMRAIENGLAAIHNRDLQRGGKRSGGGRACFQLLDCGAGRGSRIRRNQHGDRTVELGERMPGTYEGEATGVAAGAWDVEIEAARASERLFRSHNRIVME